MEMNCAGVFTDQESGQVRPVFLFNFGFHLANCGVLLLALHYSVVHLFANVGDELLAWVVPTAQASCFFGAGFLTAGLVGRSRMNGSRNLSERLSAEKPSGGMGKRAEFPIGKKEDGQSVRDLRPIIALLQKLSGEEFSAISALYFQETGFRTAGENNHSQGVDFFLYSEGDYRPIAVISLVGSKMIDRERIVKSIRRVMLSGAAEGVLLTAGEFEADAIDYAREKELSLIDGAGFAARILALSKEGSDRLLEKLHNY